MGVALSGVAYLPGWKGRECGKRSPVAGCLSRATLQQREPFPRNWRKMLLSARSLRRARLFDHNVLADRVRIALAVLGGDRELVQSKLGERRSKVPEHCVRGYATSGN